jgi:anti-anti-sigma factor
MAEHVHVEVVTASGELDTTGSEPLRRDLSDLINRGHGAVVDLRQATLIDSAGGGVLLTASERCRLRQLPFALVLEASPFAPVRRSLRLLGLLRSLPVYTDLEEALTSLGAGADRGRR